VALISNMTIRKPKKDKNKNEKISKKPASLGER
jgi:hypothetical protein